MSWLQSAGTVQVKVEKLVKLLFQMSISCHDKSPARRPGRQPSKADLAYQVCMWFGNVTQTFKILSKLKM